MNDYFSEFSQKAGSFTEKELPLLKEELQFQTLKKNALLLQQGEVCSAVSYVIEGSAHHYTIDEEGDKKIIELSVSKDWVINHKSFTSRKPSEYTIQCSEECMIYTLSIDAIHRLIGVSQTFLQLGKVLEEAVSRITFFDQNYTPDEKYKHILENRPELLQKFSQKLIASYLKISPETFSRVRKRFSKI